MGEPGLLFKALSETSRLKLPDGLYGNDAQKQGELCVHHDMERKAVTPLVGVIAPGNMVT